MEELLPPMQPPNSGATAAGNAPGNGQGPYAPPMDEMQMLPENVDPYASIYSPGVPSPQVGGWLPYTQMQSKSGKYNNNVAHSGMIQTEGPESLGQVQNEQGQWVNVSAVSPDGTPSAPQSWAQGAKNYIAGQQEAKQEWMNREGISPQEADALEAQMMEQGGGVQDLAKLYGSSRTGQAAPPQSWAQGAADYAAANTEYGPHQPVTLPEIPSNLPSWAQGAQEFKLSQGKEAAGPFEGGTAMHMGDIEREYEYIPTEAPAPFVQQAAESKRSAAIGPSYEQDMHEGTPTPLGQNRLRGMPQKSLAEMAKERQTAAGTGQSTSETGDDPTIEPSRPLTFAPAYQALKESKGGLEPSAAETANLYNQFVAAEGGPDIMGGINVDRTAEAIVAGKEALTENPVADKVQQVVMGLPTSDGNNLDVLEGSGFGNYGGRGIDHDKAAADDQAGSNL